MQKWQLEAFVQRTLARLPRGAALYYVGQRLLGGFRRFNIESKLRQAAMLRETLLDGGGSIAGQRAVEIGTGWTPVVPIYMWLHGQAACHTLDVTPLLRPELVRRTAEQFAARLTAGDARLAQVWPERAARLHELVAAQAGAAELLQAWQLVYHGSADTAATGLPDASVDLVYSNTVLEHVPGELIPAIFREAHRMLRPDGWMAHQIDLSDHFAHSDGRISRLNFLRYSTAEFSQYNSSILYQNRWRPRQYRAALEETRFAVRLWRPLIERQLLDQVKGLPLHPDFAGLPADELCTTGIQLVAQPLRRQ